jgi:hypothetical protein
MKWRYLNTSILVIIAILFGLSRFAAAENNTRIHLPFRITEGIYRYKPLEKEHIQLTINGIPRDVAALTEKEKSISRPPELGRSLILSFSIAEYNQKISDTVSYFVTEVLNNTDILLLFTPLNVFRLDVSRNKIKMVEDIEKLVRNDIETFNKQRRNAERILENRIKKLNSHFRNPMALPGPVIGTQNFLRYYITEYDSYTKQYILPNLENFRQSIQYLGIREGERWCIHIQQREIYSIISKTRRVYRQIKDAFSSGIWGKNLLTTNISIFEGQLAQIESRTAKPLVKYLVDGNINFSSIIFGSLNERISSNSFSDGIYIEKIYKDAALKSGGLDIVSSSPIEGIRQIVEHRDRYFQLAFDYNQQAEEKKIKLTLDGTPIKPVFKKYFSRTEIHRLIEYLSAKKVTIDNEQFNGKAINFSIKSFELSENGGEPFGILKVRIQLFDLWGEQVYNTSRILRAVGESERSVEINHSLPSEYKGKYMIMISITDLLRNSQTSLTRRIDL